MKMNSTGKYEHDNNFMYARDIETGEEMIYLICEKQRLVIRSVFEEDVYRIATLQKMNNRIKKAFVKEFSKENARYEHFLIEELDGFQDDGMRKIIADLNIKPNNEMETCIYIKKNLDSRLAQIIRTRVVNAITRFCTHIGENFNLKVYRPAE